MVTSNQERYAVIKMNYDHNDCVYLGRSAQTTSGDRKDVSDTFGQHCSDNFECLNWKNKKMRN